MVSLTFIKPTQIYFLISLINQRFEPLAFHNNTIPNVKLPPGAENIFTISPQKYF